VTGTLVGDAISPANLPAGGRVWWTALSALDAVWTQILVEEAMFSGWTSNPVAGSCASEVGHTRLHGHTVSCLTRSATLHHAQATIYITSTWRGQHATCVAV